MKENGIENVKRFQIFFFFFAFQDSSNEIS